MEKNRKTRKIIKELLFREEFANRKRFAIMMIGIFFLGFWLSFLIRANLGTDPCSFMNLTVSGKLGILFGTWQLILNATLFIIVIAFGREHIGPGTIANMVLIGYIADFFGFLWDSYIPKSFFTDTPTRILTFAVSFTMFVISAALYMNADMGLAPYDAIPLMIKKYLLKRVPFAIVRMGYDFTAILIGILCGGIPNIGHILMALFLGPVITTIGRFLNRHIFHLDSR
jgi:uncharacterized membrane protein YczE